MNDQERALQLEVLLMRAVNSDNPVILDDIANALADLGYNQHASAVRSKAQRTLEWLEQEAERQARLRRIR